MMKFKIIFVFVALLMATACSQQVIDEQHKTYLLNKGWEVKKQVDHETYTLHIPDEMLTNYEASGIFFLRDYLGKEVTRYSYELKEKDAEGEHLYVYLFEVDGDIIGGYGVLPSWAPGLFNLDDKERLLNKNLSFLFMKG